MSAQCGRGPTRATQIAKRARASGRQGPVPRALARIWLSVLAITIHNLPEGLAVGVGFGGGDIARGTTLP